jgi:mannan endo-1,4-beta-mannosidase
VIRRRTAALSAVQILLMAGTVIVAATIALSDDDAIGSAISPTPTTEPQFTTSTSPDRTTGSSAPATTALPSTSLPDAVAPVGTLSGQRTAFDWVDDVAQSDRTFLGVSTENSSPEEAASFAQAAGRSVDAVMLSRDWASNEFDLAAISDLAQAGHLPIIAWEPWDHAARLNGDRLRAVQPAYRLASIIAGDHDNLIRNWARGAAQWGQPLGLRLGHEMNGYWYPWSESANGNNPGEFAEAWRHVHDLFTAQGATNVIWIWSPNLVNPTLTDVAELWPGDTYVDWVGLVGYLGNGIDPRQWLPTFGQLFGPTIAEIRDFTDKPMVITEIGATDLGGHKAEWITEVLDAVSVHPDIIGLMWFELSKEQDWRIVSSEAAREAFARGVSDDQLWGAEPTPAETTLAETTLADPL